MLSPRTSFLIMPLYTLGSLEVLLLMLLYIHTLKHTRYQVYVRTNFLSLVVEPFVFRAV